MQYTYFLLIKMIISLHNAHFFGSAPCHRTHSFTKKPADKTGTKFYICLQIFLLFFGRFSCERGVGDWNRLECNILRFVR
jgi:hypothetical protein